MVNHPKMIFHIEAGQPGTRGEKHSTTGTSLIQFAIENGHISWIYPLKMVIFTIETDD